MALTRALITAIAYAVSTQIHAGTFIEENKTIDQLIIFSSGHAALLLNNPDTIDTNNCGSLTLVEVTIDSTPESRLIYSTLLAAKTANQPVSITVDDHNNTTDCTLTQVNLLDY